MSQTNEQMKKFNFRTSQTMQMNVRVDEKTFEKIGIIAANEAVEKTEVVRELIKVGIEEYEKLTNPPASGGEKENL